MKRKKDQAKQELVERDNSLPTEKEEDSHSLSMLDDMQLKTTWGVSRKKRLINAKKDLLDAAAAACESHIRLSEAAGRLRTTDERIMKEHELEDIEHDVRKAKLQKELAEAKAAAERVSMEDKKERARLDAETREHGSKVLKTRKQYTSKYTDPTLREIEKEGNRFLERDVELPKIQEKLFSSIDKKVGSGILTKEEGRAQKEKISLWIESKHKEL